MKKSLRTSIAVILALSFESQAFAIGGGFIGNEVLSARSAGQGYVGVAGVNNDPSVVFANPAAMTTLKGTQVSVGAHLENINGSYKDDAGNKTKERTVNAFVPNTSITQSLLGGRLTLGLGITSPFGLETHWDSNAPMRYVATNSRLQMVDITPAMAYQIHPKVSVGVGVDYYNLSKAQLDRQVYTDGVNSTLGFATTGAPDATSSLQGQAANWGYHAGLMVQPTERQSIGLTYHSKVDLRINGNLTIRNMSGVMASVFGGSDYSTSAYTDVVIPSNLQLAYAYKPIEKLTLEADAGWYHWSEGRDLNVRYAETDATRLAVLTNSGSGNPSPFNSHDMWSVATGANYELNEKWEIRSGFWYVPKAIPETAFSPAFMDLTRYGISLGTGYSLTQNITLDFAYNLVFFHNRTVHNTVQVNGSGIPDGATLGSGIAESNGTYKSIANLFGFNLTYRFGDK